MARRATKSPIDIFSEIEEKEEGASSRERELTARELRELEKYTYSDYPRRSRIRPKKRKRKQFRISLPWKLVANLLIISGVLLIFYIFENPVIEEIKYLNHKIFGVRFKVAENLEKSAVSAAEEKNTKVIVPESYDFGIVVPKIDANSKIIANVDPFKDKEFLPALKTGVAHAKWTAFPGQGGNVYLFAHSTDSFYNVGRYNAVFYLLGKLENGDEIDIYFLNKLYKYFVFEKKMVSVDEVKYLKSTGEETLTLQTCYPPGTTIKRLIVRAKPKT